MDISLLPTLLCCWIYLVCVRFNEACTLIKTILLNFCLHLILGPYGLVHGNRESTPIHCDSFFGYTLDYRILISISHYWWGTSPFGLTPSCPLWSLFVGPLILVTPIHSKSQYATSLPELAFAKAFQSRFFSPHLLW